MTHAEFHHHGALYLHQRWHSISFVFLPLQTAHTQENVKFPLSLSHAEASLARNDSNNEINFPLQTSAACQ